MPRETCVRPGRRKEDIVKHRKTPESTRQFFSGRDFDGSASPWNSHRLARGSIDTFNIGLSTKLEHKTYRAGEVGAKDERSLTANETDFCSKTLWTESRNELEPKTQL